MRYSGSRFDRGGFSVPGGRVTLSFFFLLLVAILLAFVHRADPSLFERWRTKVVDVSAPVLETVSWPVKAVRNLLTDLGEFWEVYEENERLRKQIEDLKVWQSAALHYERQIAQYEKLMKVQPLPGIEYVTARLIADGGSPFKHTFILNAGAKQGVENGQGVVHGLDLIGRIVNVGQHSARVLRVTDINSRIPVMVEPSRQRAIMAGDNTGQPKLEFVESELDIRAGNRVVTSGDGGLLPPGLPIGEVVQQEAGKFRVKPNSNHNRFGAVRVVRYSFPVDVDTSVGGERDLPLGGEPAPGTDSSGAEDGAPVAGPGTEAPDETESEAAPEEGNTPAAAPVRAAENRAPAPGPAAAEQPAETAAEEAEPEEAEPEEAEPEEAEPEEAEPEEAEPEEAGEEESDTGAAADAGGADRQGGAAADGE
ncbi:MAG: rod shape-determining protein MreC [Alphaproteobacteria bacterium]